MFEKGLSAQDREHENQNVIMSISRVVVPGSSDLSRTNSNCAFPVETNLKVHLMNVGNNNDDIAWNETSLHLIANQPQLKICISKRLRLLRYMASHDSHSRYLITECISSNKYKRRIGRFDELNRLLFEHELGLIFEARNPYSTAEQSKSIWLLMPQAPEISLLIFLSKEIHSSLLVDQTSIRDAKSNRIKTAAVYNPSSLPSSKRKHQTDSGLWRDRKKQTISTVKTNVDWKSLMQISTCNRPIEDLTDHETHQSFEALDSAKVTLDIIKPSSEEAILTVPSFKNATATNSSSLSVEPLGEDVRHQRETSNAATIYPNESHCRSITEKYYTCIEKNDPTPIDFVSSLNRSLNGNSDRVSSFEDFTFSMSQINKLCHSKILPHLKRLSDTENANEDALLMGRDYQFVQFLTVQLHIRIELYLSLEQTEHKWNNSCNETINSLLCNQNYTKNKSKTGEKTSVHLIGNVYREILQVLEKISLSLPPHMGFNEFLKSTFCRHSVLDKNRADLGRALFRHFELEHRALASNQISNHMRDCKKENQQTINLPVKQYNKSLQRALFKLRHSESPPIVLLGERDFSQPAPFRDLDFAKCKSFSQDQDDGCIQQTSESNDGFTNVSHVASKAVHKNLFLSKPGGKSCYHRLGHFNMQVTNFSQRPSCNLPPPAGKKIKDDSTWIKLTEQLQTQRRSLRKPNQSNSLTLANEIEVAHSLPEPCLGFELSSSFVIGETPSKDKTFPPQPDAQLLSPMNSLSQESTPLRCSTRAMYLVAEAAFAAKENKIANRF